MKANVIPKGRHDQIKKAVMFLGKAIKNAPAGDPSQKEMKEIYAAIRKRRKTLLPAFSH